MDMPFALYIFVVLIWIGSNRLYCDCLLPTWDQIHLKSLQILILAFALSLCPFMGSAASSSDEDYHRYMKEGGIAYKTRRYPLAERS